MNRVKIAVLLAALAVGLPGLAVVLAQTSTSFDLSWNVLGSGGGSSESANFRLGGTLGQTAPDTSESTNFRLDAGFWPGVAADTDGDGVPDAIDNCPAWPNPDQSLPPWPVAADDPDCDGWSTDDENFIGTDPNLACGIAAWPPDFNDSQRVDIFDVNILKPAFFSVAPGPPYDARFDIKPDDSDRIDIFDVNRLKPVFFVTCIP